MNLGVIIQYQYSMLPYQNNYSQYVSDMYASAFFYQPIFVFPNQESCWGALNYAEPSPSIIASQVLEHPHFQDEHTKPNTKTRKTKEKPVQESSASCESAAEESEDSPDFKSRQKYGRNINSNIFHHMLKIIRSDQQFEKVLDRLLLTGRFDLTKKHFNEMLHKRVSKLNPYVTNAKMNSFLNGVSKVKLAHGREMTKTDSDFYQVLRILCRYYLSNVHLLFVFNKLKLQKKSKGFHVEGVRKILEIMIK